MFIFIEQGREFGSKIISPCSPFFSVAIVEYVIRGDTELCVGSVTMSAQNINRLHIRNRRMSPPSGCNDVSYNSCVGSVTMSAHRCRSRNPNRKSPMVSDDGLII